MGIEYPCYQLSSQTASNWPQVSYLWKLYESSPLLGWYLQIRGRIRPGFLVWTFGLHFQATPKTDLGFGRLRFKLKLLEPFWAMKAHDFPMTPLAVALNYFLGTGHSGHSKSCLETTLRYQTGPSPLVLSLSMAFALSQNISQQHGFPQLGVCSLQSNLTFLLCTSDMTGVASYC